MTYDPNDPLSPQAQFIRDKMSSENIAKELYRITNGLTDWRTDRSPAAQEEWNNGPAIQPAGKAYAEYLKEAITKNPTAPRLKAEANRVLTPVGGGRDPKVTASPLTPAVDTGKTVRRHPPRIR